MTATFTPWVFLMKLLQKSALALCLFTAVALPAFSVYAAEDAQPFTTAQQVDLTQILPPPPANDSVQTKRELQEVVDMQQKRTPEMATQAKADAEENVWVYSNVMGPKFNAKALPVLSAFFERVVATEAAVVDPAKDFWKRPRPHMLDSRIEPIVKRSTSGSWPSGHTTLGTLMGITLANMVPEKRAEIMARAWQYGDNRVVAGIHYPSDIEMGRIAGSVISQQISHQQDFQQQYQQAREELRHALDLPAGK
ncbi:Major phosphate-irrepressible acid phosphatase precursor [Serratia grimesii]|nr:Major phosphate-irrepressible acid phosphatase precursor [Serratia grimesii]CAI0833423.1 Major phosphate-irrepressible acid phosphatase precursor [Serratia grimesii]CAI2473850.1 Major phosphate-irrepressible acid phosphatase precursor [Serratia grimesii]CAI2791437.1 Major phosphate-irrepressible acid phosphatase precursor [Serratia grimesii]SUI31667.1 Major phosphate-irrepressible acid phosphatase precursor [Serratia grimesii]